MSASGSATDATRLVDSRSPINDSTDLESQNQQTTAKVDCIAKGMKIGGGTAAVIGVGILFVSTVPQNAVIDIALAAIGGGVSLIGCGIAIGGFAYQWCHSKG